jgi:DNA-binding response OmpR family regulator
MSAATILIVDDESTIRTSERLCLEDAGYVVRQVGNGAEALEQLASDPPDLMLLDLAMPVMDGMTVLAEMQSQWSRYPTRVVVVTAHGSVKTAIQAIRLGASDFLEKPFAPEDLRLSVASVLREDRQSYRTEGEGYIELLERVRQALCERHFELAERELTRVATISDSDAAYLNLAGVVQEAHGRVEPARCFYSRSLAQDWSYRPALQNLRRLEELAQYGKSSLIVALGGDIQDDRRVEFGQTPRESEPRAYAKGRSTMWDILFIAVTILFFGIAIGYTYACERL